MSEAARRTRLERLNNPRAAGWVAKARNGTVIGLATPYRDDEGNQHVGSLYVAKEWHGKGVSQALMQNIIDWFDDTKPIVLGVVAYNDRAKAFYRKWGFREVPGSEMVYDNLIPEIMMSREPQTMRRTSRAIIIKDKRLLLVTGHGAGFYWTPGGGVEGDETAVETLYREVKEELGLDVLGYSHYASYEYEDQAVSNYIVEINDELILSNEITAYIWYQVGDKVKVSSGLEFVLLPRLIENGLL